MGVQNAFREIPKIYVIFQNAARKRKLKFRPSTSLRIELWAAILGLVALRQILWPALVSMQWLWRGLQALAMSLGLWLV